MRRHAALLALAAAAILCAPARAADPASPSAAACTKSPARNGQRIGDERVLIGFTISAVSVAEQRADKAGVLVYPPASWCTEGDIEIQGERYTLWHNMGADAPNASGPFDRLAPAGRDPQNGFGAVTLLADRNAPTTRRDGDPPAPPVVYHVIIESEDDVSILGSYDGPLSAGELAKFAPGRYVTINAHIDKKTHKVTLYRML